MTFIEVDIRYRMEPLYILYLKILTYIFKVTKLEKLIAGKLRANEKFSIITFIKVDIRHQIGLLRMVCSVTFTKIVKVKHFNL